MHVALAPDGQVAWSEEGKLLEYHRGRGVFYPFIQVQGRVQDPPARPAAEGEPERASPAIFVVAGGLLLLGYELGVNADSSPLLRALLAFGILVYAVVSADRARCSRKDPQVTRGVERRLAALMGIDARPQEAGAGEAALPSQPVKAISWHPYLNRFALALSKGHFARPYKNESSEHIAFYDMDAERWLSTVVKHEFQRDVACLQYQPNSGGSLAVGCREGICLWSLEPAQAVSQTGSAPAAETAVSAWMSWYRHLPPFSALPRPPLPRPLLSHSKALGKTWSCVPSLAPPRP